MALQYHVGPFTDHTTYKAEAIGITLILELLSHDRSIKIENILLDNQGIHHVVRNIWPKAAQHSLEYIHDMANRVAAPSEAPNKPKDFI